MVAAWNDRARWLALCDGSGCPICQRGAPLDLLVEFPACWITAQPEAPLPAYVCVVAKQHVVEPFQLSPADQAAFWSDAMNAAKALAEAVHPVKMNYEIHGNSIPHLHLHLLPRQLDDPFVDRPIAMHKASFTRTAADLERLRDALLSIRPGG